MLGVGSVDGGAIDGAVRGVGKVRVGHRIYPFEFGIAREMAGGAGRRREVVDLVEEKLSRTS
jgi:hypothetical protein